ncbi:MAG: hypothetical protein WC514_01720 [Candidatus Paceibacterota bacterium]
MESGVYTETQVFRTAQRLSNYFEEVKSLNERLKADLPEDERKRLGDRRRKIEEVLIPRTRAEAQL